MEQCKIEQYGGIPCPIKRRKKEKGERRKKKKRKRKRVEERKKKKWDIGGVEGCGKVEGKGGSPEASGDGGGRLGKGW